MTTQPPEHLPLLNFFTFHLNRLYYAKSHLIGKLPELQKLSRIPTLTTALEKMAEDLRLQVNRIELIFTLLDKGLDSGAAQSINRMAECIYQDAAKENDSTFGNLSILYYLEVLEGIEMSCFKLLRMAAVKLDNRQVKQLLRENYENAKDMRTLLLLIATELITGDSGRL